MCNLYARQDQAGTDPRRSEGVALCNLPFFIFFLFLHNILKDIDDDGDQRKEKDKTKRKSGKHFGEKVRSSERKRDQRDVITRVRGSMTGKEKREPRKAERDTRRSNEKAAAAKGGAVRMWGATSSSHSTREDPARRGAACCSIGGSGARILTRQRHGGGITRQTAARGSRSPNGYAYRKCRITS